MGYGPLRTHFVSRKRITIDQDECIGCKLCMNRCPVRTVIGYSDVDHKAYLADALNCGGCGACLRSCPKNAIHIVEEASQNLGDYYPRSVIAPGQNKDSVNLSNQTEDTRDER